MGLVSISGPLVKQFSLLMHALLSAAIGFDENNFVGYPHHHVVGAMRSAMDPAVNRGMKVVISRACKSAAEVRMLRK